MRVVPFPSAEVRAQESAWLAELEAALSGEAQGPAAESWRELRSDVRALAPPIDPEFQHRLHERLVRPVKQQQPRRRRVRSFVFAGAPAIAAVLIALVVAGPWRGSASRGPVTSAASTSLTQSSGGASSSAGKANRAIPNTTRVPPAVVQPEGGVTVPEARAKAGPDIESSAGANATPEVEAGAAASGVVEIPAPAGNAAAAPGRVQQTSASLTLGTSAAGVQSLADSVSRLVVSDGGFVENSQVQVQQGGSSEATLTLRLPSAKLSAAIAALGRLAPVRAESQSLQDITSEYDAARQRLADANGERSALLLAIAKAPTQEKVEVLRARLAQTGREIVRARAALAAETRRASTAEVGVTVLGDMRASSEGLTLHRGLHDAGRILLGTAVVLLIAAAVLVPLGLLIAALLAGQGALRRRRRERVLEGP